MEESFNEKNTSDYSSKIKLNECHLILLNDDVNTFDYVIQCLVGICKFDYEKAEQCTLITHIKGHYSIMSGSKEVLDELQNKLYNKNIYTKIEKR